MTDREELRARLRAKISQARSPVSAPNAIAQQMRKDPTSALMQLGIDDAELLRKAPKLANNPKSFLENEVAEILTKMAHHTTDEVEEGAPPTIESLKTAGSETLVNDAHSDDEAPPPLRDEDDDAEEAPPPLSS